MKCKVCGAEIPEGSLYCEKCGQDIHIVPDFTEFAEKKAEETVKNMMNDFDDDEADFGRSPEGANDERPVKKSESAERIKPKRGWIRFAVLAVAVMLLVSVSLGFINRSSKTEYILESAKSAVAEGNISKAVALLEGIDASEPSDVDALLYLAQLYIDTGDTISYENLLLSLISMPFATSEQNAICYEMLLAIYNNSEDYVSMADILLTCNNVEIKDKYIDYCIQIPEINLDSGYYGTDQLLKITAPGNAEIFYTTDGSEPNEESLKYEVPLLLTKGEYSINVRTRNLYGIWSPVTEVTYVIESEELYEAIEPTAEEKKDEPVIIELGGGLYLVDGVPSIFSTQTGTFLTFGANIDGQPYIFNENGELVPLDLTALLGTDPGADASESGSEENGTQINEETENTEPGY